jgi:hypothetical protein
MPNDYQARWASKARVDSLRKTGKPRDVLILDVFSGFIVIEPVGSDLADGQVLSQQEADYELQPAWFLGPKRLLREARTKLGIDAAAPAEMSGATA